VVCPKNTKPLKKRGYEYPLKKSIIKYKVTYSLQITTLKPFTPNHKTNSLKALL